MGNLTTPKRVQKLQMALQAKAKEEPEYRFYLEERWLGELAERDAEEVVRRLNRIQQGWANVWGR